MRKELIIYSSLLVFLLVMTMFFTGFIFHSRQVQYLMIFVITFMYYLLHMTIYHNYSKALLMTFYCFLGLVFTSGIVGLILCLYTVVKAIKKIKELKEYKVDITKGEEL